HGLDLSQQRERLVELALLRERPREAPPSLQGLLRGAGAGQLPPQLTLVDVVGGDGPAQAGVLPRGGSLQHERPGGEELPPRCEAVIHCPRRLARVTCSAATGAITSSAASCSPRSRRCVKRVSCARRYISSRRWRSALTSACSTSGKGVPVQRSTARSRRWS